MRVLFCGGGTAGHVNPALAIAQTILKNSPSSEIAYVVTRGGIENKLVPYRKYEINVMGLRRSFSLSNIKAVFLTINAIRESKKIIQDFKPNIIIGTGGYACYPVIYAGHAMGIKTVVHESNAIPGKALKMLEKRVDRIFLNFREAEKYFSCKEKIIHTGNPIREGFSFEEKAIIKSRLGIKEDYVILCYGGSLGARAINDGALEIIENIIKENKNVRLIWASGKREYKEMYYELRNRKFEKMKNLEFCEYIYDMPQKISCADIVICRAGAMSISEMAYAGKCAIFIPSPNVVDNHQFKNAEALSSCSSAILLRESEIFNLSEIVMELLENKEKRNGYERRIKSFSVSDSNKIIYNEIRKILKA
ncbi:MAG: UDP-N-acetylglucosamine--N-acetylmuramyl-(pentapeptide) pyrophosphoryl-undecaprenol N-acetylglucosamine transferase [Clostridia bacterium]|nr:UDP-N-acetylglucosamine--N-acetylmuramyl-(pentapeptide) pyrophosphoryl-undecaprenol N-acetylglucosamine transferase [Clostridia bacterium]